MNPFSEVRIVASARARGDMRFHCSVIAKFVCGYFSRPAYATAASPWRCSSSPNLKAWPAVGLDRQRVPGSTVCGGTWPSPPDAAGLEHGVENEQQLAHHGDQRHFGGFTGRSQAQVKRLEHWVAEQRGNRRHV